MSEYIEWLEQEVESLEETPVDYVEAAKLLQKNRKECAEWLKGKDTFCRKRERSGRWNTSVVKSI